MASTAYFDVVADGASNRLQFFGSWTIANLGDVDPVVRQYVPSPGVPVVLDCEHIDRMDTAGAWILYRLMRRLSDNRAVSFERVDHDQQALIDVVGSHEEHVEEIPAHKAPLLASVERFGANIERAFLDTKNSIGFFGMLIQVLFRMVRRPKRFRLTSFVHHIEISGFDALPIIMLITFMIGAVVAFMSADILSELGVEIYTVELVTITFLREFGVLLTAIMIAGRSGSAFTAQIGSMKAHEEIDAMRALGLDPMELLIIPRTLALLVSLPLLTFIANVMGFVGGALVCWMTLDISPGMFMARASEATELRHLWVGFIKAPFFAVLIAVIGCYQGLRVEGTAETIGAHTTASVVQAIFATIVVDAAFAVFFLIVGL